MFIELIRFDNNTVTIKVGHTEADCVGSQTLDLPALGHGDLYPVLLHHRRTIEQHLLRASRAQLMRYEFPNGQLPITEL